jgi:hypothetical protein
MLGAGLLSIVGGIVLVSITEGPSLTVSPRASEVSAQRVSLVATPAHGGALVSLAGQF